MRDKDFICEGRFNYYRAAKHLPLETVNDIVGLAVGLASEELTPDGAAYLFRDRLGEDFMEAIRAAKARTRHA